MSVQQKEQRMIDLEDHLVAECCVLCSGAVPKVRDQPSNNRNGGS